MATPSLSDLLNLDVEERLELIRILWNSIVDSGRELPLTDSERVELDRRLAEHAADPDAGIHRIRGEH